MAFDGSRAEFYRERARKLRAMAEKCVAKQQFEQIAKQYDDLARQVECGHLPR